MTNTTNTAAASVTAILFEHEDGRYAINPDTTGDPAWHRLGPVDVSAIAAEPAQPVAQEGGTLVKLIEKKIAGMSPSEASAFMAARAALAASGNDQAAPDMRDPYGGAREDLAIWRKRALEAEALNRKFATSVNGPTFMGEPADSDSALMAREIHESQEDTLLICASDLQHSAIYDNHVEMQSCIRAVADRITALASVIEGVGRAALVAPAQAATAKQSPHPEYDKGFSDGWNRCEARQAAAPSQAGEYPPLGKGSLWRDAEGIRGYGTDPGPGPWYTTEDVHKAINADRAARGAAQAAPVDATTWQPIATAPKDGKAILLRSKNGRIADGLWSAANSSTGFWAWAYVHQEPAEWMPKPGSPAARAQEQQP